MTMPEAERELEMLESRRQAERRRAGLFGQSIGGAASISNGNDAETPQSPAPTDPGSEEFEDIFGNVIPFPGLPRGPAPAFAGLKTEPLGASEPDEPAE